MREVERLTRMLDDLYAVLGVTDDADEATLRRAFRARAKELHPDRNPDARDGDARFKALGRAYAVLSDASRRADYDASRGKPRRRGPSPEVRRVTVAWERASASEPTDRGPTNGLEMLTVLLRPKKDDRPGDDRLVGVAISLGDALRGVTLELVGPEGSRGLEGRRVDVPRGTTRAFHARLSGLGFASEGSGPPGDLVVDVRIAENAAFRVEGRDLRLTLPVTIAEAYLGATIDVPTPTGTIALRVPPLSGPGTVLRVRGKGVPGARGASGDLLVRLDVVLPSATTERLDALFARLDAEQPGSPLRDAVTL
ncbi:MAG: DnaJ C-terminal domain-containing protein [Polyangiaceae bacterium]